MKSIFLWIILLSFWRCGALDSYQLNGTLKGIAEGAKVTLTLAATHRDEKIESETIVRDGHFVLTGQLTEPRLYLLSIEEPTGVRGNYILMLENGNIVFTATKGNPSHGQYMTLEQVSVEGSEADKVYREKMAFRDKLNQMYSSLQEKRQEINQQIMETKNNHDKIIQTDVYKAFENDERNFFMTVEKMISDAVKVNGDSFWGPLLLLCNCNYFSPNDTLNQGIYNNFSEEAKNSFYGQLLKKQLFIESLKGKTLPLFSLPDRNQEERFSVEFVKDKKCVLIDFWASWCNPCRKSIPVLKEVYKEFAAKGLEIISISIDKKNEDWQKALDGEQFLWPSLIDTKNVSKEKFDVRTIPAFFLVDENGVVVEDNLSIQDVRSKVKELLQ